MPLLQLHMAGQEPEERVQAGAWVASPWPAETGGEVSESLTLLLRLQICRWERTEPQSHSQENTDVLRVPATS